MGKEFPVVSRRRLLAWVLLALAAAGCGRAKARSLRVGILNWSERIPTFQVVYRGLLDGLIHAGLGEEVGVEFLYRDANQSEELALAMAHEFAAGGVDVIAALGTGCSLAARQAAGRIGIPIVFTIVGAPEATGLIRRYGAAGGTVTGVSMEIPVAEQFRRVREAIPSLRRIGILYATATPQAIATAEEAVDAARELGWLSEVATLSPADLPQLPPLAESLAGRVDGVYIPTDPILYEPDRLRSIIRACDGRKVPAIVVTGEAVAEGGLLAVHCDFRGIGREAAQMVARILRGADVRTIPPKRPGSQRLSLNLGKARALGLRIPRNLILRADAIIE